jgi:hypothetical protein
MVMFETSEIMGVRLGVPSVLSRLFLGMLTAWLVLAVSGPAQTCKTVLNQREWERSFVEFPRNLDFAAYNPAYQNVRIPLAVHIVRKTDGTLPSGPCPGSPPDTLDHPGGLRRSQLDTAIFDLNARFGQVGWEFYLYGGVDYIDNDFYYCEMTSEAVWTQLVQVNHVEEAVNVYFVPNTGFCGLSTYVPGPGGVRGILVDASCAGIPDNPSTLAHEMGHYFGLYHTHETGFGLECPDGSNCLTAGDLLCDTPADPGLAGRVDTFCTYNPGFEPPPPASCGMEPYDPQPYNLMSIARPVCRDYFTAGQINKMIFTLENLRPELVTELPGCCVGITGNVDAGPDEQIDIGDLTALIAYLYIPPNPVPTCLSEANTDGDPDGLVDIGDLTVLIDFLYGGGAEPAPCDGGGALRGIFPMEVDNYWIYRETTWVNDQLYAINDDSIHVIGTYSDTLGEWWLLNSGLLWLGDTVMVKGDTIFSRYWVTEVAPGFEPFPYAALEYIPPRNELPHEYMVVVEGDIALLRYVNQPDTTIVTAAGSFGNCYYYTGGVFLFQEEYEHYLRPDVGFVYAKAWRRNNIIYTTNFETHYWLVRYRVGAQ